MTGAILGDIAGSVYEFDNCKDTDIELFAPWQEQECFATDDSIMTLAIAEAIMESDGDIAVLGEKAVECMRRVGRPHTDCGYGGRFRSWMYGDDPKPYRSFGNGAAMRVSPCAYAASSLEEALLMAEEVTAVTHDHPEGIKGAKAVAAAVYLARIGADKDMIQDYIEDNYYTLDEIVSEIRESYKFDETCQGTVPQAIEVFLESESYEDAIRLAISIGGDSDTVACITGAIAGAFYGVPEELKDKVEFYLNEEDDHAGVERNLFSIYERFTDMYPEKII